MYIRLAKVGRFINYGAINDNKYQSITHYSLCAHLEFYQKYDQISVSDLNLPVVQLPH